MGCRSGAPGERSREIGRIFGGVHNGEIGGKWWTRAGRLQGLRAPPQINISFQPRQPPPIPRRHLSIPFSTLRLLPLSSRPRVAASRSQSSFIPVCFPSSPPSPRARFCLAPSRHHSSLTFLLQWLCHRHDRCETLSFESITDRQVRRGFLKIESLDLFAERKWNVLNYLCYSSFNYLSRMVSELEKTRGSRTVK